VLQVKDLKICFDDGSPPAVHGVSFTVGCAEILGVVGESGSGKSMTALALAGLLPGNARAQGEADFWGRRLRFACKQDWRGLSGRQIGMVFQDPAGCLNPVMTAGEQVSEVIRIHLHKSRWEAETEAQKLFASLGLHPPGMRMRQYPHQLSGGMKQRVMLAAAVCCNPRLIIADEPTTALDVSVQAQILALLKGIVIGSGTALILISHDLGVIARLADRVLVMCGGVVVEDASVFELFSHPLHPYTQLLMQCAPRLNSTLPVVPPENKCSTVGLCTFLGRCQYCGPLCKEAMPPLKLLTKKRWVRCHYRR
jgi:oligopeptide/dipeptide ABC transporter ATP-binding protein